MKGNSTCRLFLCAGIFAMMLILSGCSRYPRNEASIYQDKSQPVEKRVDALIRSMTLREKIELLGGTGQTTTPIPRLGIPALKMSDGALGVVRGKSTAFPCGTAMAASWDTLLLRKVGAGIGEELREKGRNVLLGPNVNIARIPMGGRDYESYGEDPYLTSRLAVSFIEGVQSQGVAATVKHFALNNQEYEREFVNVLASKRAINEIYLPAFKAAVREAGVMCVMAAYNKVNGQYCTQNNYLLDDKLRRDWKFDGLIMSDWWAVHSAVPTANGCLDLEMPTGKYMCVDSLTEAVRAGKVSEVKIDGKVKHILTLMFKLGLFDKKQESDSIPMNPYQHRKIAYRAALEGIVLLKNNRGILPLNPKELRSIAVIGPNAAVARTGGGGSSEVSPVYSVSPLEALQKALGNKVKINYAKGVSFGSHFSAVPSKILFMPDKNETGLLSEYFDNPDLAGRPRVLRRDSTIDFHWSGETPPVHGLPSRGFSVSWTGRVRMPKSGDYLFGVFCDGGARLYLNGNLVIDDWINHTVTVDSTMVHLQKGTYYDIKLEYREYVGGASVMLGYKMLQKGLFGKAIAAARSSDIAIVFAGTSAKFETEGRDRTSLDLPYNQDILIKRVAAANKNTIVVMISGAPVLMSRWINDVAAVVQAWFGGDEAGNAIAAVLLGKYNPSGRLPITFPVRWSDCSAYGSYKKHDSVSVYSDGIFVGYRWFDEKHIKPLFPFGYGLSYTTFSYSRVRTSHVGNYYAVSFDVTNTGDRAGVAIPELYVHDPTKSIVVPVKELKRFARISLRPGETKEVTFNLTKHDFAHYYPDIDKWHTHPGEYDILIGSSSRDILLRTSISVE